MNRTFGVIGGDRRQAELARLLEADGHPVVTYGLGRWAAERETALECAATTDVVILPLPLCREGDLLNCEGEPLTAEELFCRFRPEQLVLAGQVKAPQWTAARDVNLRDYFRREELTVANAAATAEAAIQVAMEHLDRTLLGLPCLVVGFGRIGKLLSHRLQGMGARVTATARRPEDLAWIRAYGNSALRTDRLRGALDHTHLVFNTVPSLVLDEKLLEQLPRDCLCVDLASEPGVDFAAAEQRGISAVWARALPGRYVPETAAAAIRDAIYNIIIEERGDPT